MAKNPRKAYVWLDIAARNGDEQAQLWRDRALAMLTPDEAAHAAAEAANTQQQLTAEARGGHEADVKDAADTASPATAPASAARGWKDIIALRFQQEIAGLGPHER
jgi:TPR repeat protein